jgi:predicted AAA+ superfamily ATPase
MSHPPNGSGQEWSRDQIVARLRYDKSTMMLEEFARVIQQRTGMEVSWAHLSNMLSGRKPPGKAVLDYLGLERVVVYRVKEWRPRKGK